MLIKHLLLSDHSECETHEADKISGSNGDEYENGCLLGCCAV
jgi:hypothetical protein